MSGLRYLVLTKVGFLLAIVPWLVVALLGQVTGIPAAIVLLFSLGGAALWGYGYGRLAEDE